MTYQGKEVFTSDDFDYAAAKPGDYVEEVCARTLQLGHGDPPTPHSSVVWMSPVSGSIVDIVFRARP